MNEESEARRILKTVKFLAAAFPRAAWRDESDAAYAMALMDAGVAPDLLARVIGRVVKQSEYLPTVAELLKVCAAVKREEIEASWRCPRCGSKNVGVHSDVVAWCMACHWDAS